VDTIDQHHAYYSINICDFDEGDRKVDCYVLFQTNKKTHKFNQFIVDALVLNMLEQESNFDSSNPCLMEKQHVKQFP